MSHVDKSVISPRLRKLLVAIFFLFAILFVDSVYLSSITFLEWLEAIAEGDNSELTAEPKANYQGAFYQYAFLVHLILGFVVIIPTIIFIALHLRKAINRPNRLAVKLGLLLFVVVIMLLVSGILLTRGLPGFEIQHPSKRQLIYWTHVVTPVLACWLFECCG